MLWVVSCCCCSMGGASKLRAGSATLAATLAAVSAVVVVVALPMPCAASVIRSRTSSVTQAHWTLRRDHGPASRLQVPETPPSQASEPQSSLLSPTSYVWPSGHGHVPPKLPVAHSPELVIRMSSLTRLSALPVHWSLCSSLCKLRCSSLSCRFSILISSFWACCTLLLLPPAPAHAQCTPLCDQLPATLSVSPSTPPSHARPLALSPTQ